MTSIAQAIIFLLTFIVKHFNVIWDTKFVLKCRATPGFYAGGKRGYRGSVNSCFFGVNIVLFVFYPPGRVIKRSIMYLSIINLDSPGQFLRLLLWIFLPVGIFYLLVSTWLRYRQSEKAAGGLRLAVESFSGHDGSEDGHAAGRGNEHAAGRGNGYAGAGEEGYKVGYTADTAGTTAEVSEEEAGKETIYRGILWMKEKYEQYREQTDKRYELLREELARSEQRYQDLLLSMEQNKNNALRMAVPREEELLAEMSAGEGEILAEARVEEGLAGRSAGELAEVRGELGAKQLVIEELEKQLRVERLKVEELVVKLQTNSQLLLNIYKELDKSINIPDGL